MFGIPEKVYRDLLAFYQNHGINATLLDKDNPETIGKEIAIKIDGRNFDLVMLKFARGSMSSGRGGGFAPTISKKVTKTHPTFRFHYAVNGMGNASEDDIRAKMNEEKTGFVSKKLVDIEWDGGRLAGLLNGDAGLKHKILTSGTTSLRVEPDRKNDIVRVIHQKKIDIIVESGGVFLKKTETRGENFPSIETLNIIDGIIEHVNIIINRKGMDKKKIEIMIRTIKCPSCGEIKEVQGVLGERVEVVYSKCNQKGFVRFR